MKVLLATGNRPLQDVPEKVQILRFIWRTIASSMIVGLAVVLLSCWCRGFVWGVGTAVLVLGGLSVLVWLTYKTIVPTKPALTAVVAIGLPGALGLIGAAVSGLTAEVRGLLSWLTGKGHPEDHISFGTPDYPCALIGLAALAIVMWGIVILHRNASPAPLANR